MRYFFPSVCSMSNHNTSYGMSLSSNPASTLSVIGGERVQKERTGEGRDGEEEGTMKGCK